MQVDERHEEFLTKLRNGTGTSAPGPRLLRSGANAGADPVPTFDANDEIVFMVDDTGAPPRRSPQPGRGRRGQRGAP